MDDDLYDEFGNYIGQTYFSSSESVEEDSSVDNDANIAEGEGEAFNKDDERAALKAARVDNRKNDIILNEDKKYYPSAQEVFGKDVEALVEEEDEQPLTEPIIKPISIRKFAYEDEEQPNTTFDNKFLHFMTKEPGLIRNIALVGPLHSGKSTFMDCLFGVTHKDVNRFYKEDRMKYSDTLFIERKLKVSLKSTPSTLLLPDEKGKFRLFNIIDTPGHINFVGEVSASLRLSDGAVIVIDASEGITSLSEKYIKAVLQENLAPVLFINKIDRLVLELKLPPVDAYYKLQLIIDEFNEILLSFSTNQIVSPINGNVLFGSSYYNILFTLETFSSKYVEHYGMNINHKALARRLWGDVFYDKEKRTFSKSTDKKGCDRTFVQFILDPLYKMFSQIVGDVDFTLSSLMSELSINLTKQESKQNIKPLLSTVFYKFFGDLNAFAEGCSKNIPPPCEPIMEKLRNLYTGEFDDSFVPHSISTCDPTGPLIVYITKLFPSKDGTIFHSFGRVFSGTLHAGQQIRVLGENYTSTDEEDSRIVTVGKLWLNMARYKISVDSVSAGGMVLIEGIDEPIAKTATIIDAKNKYDIYIFKPLEFFTIPVIKISVEPVNPSELPKMLDGLRKVNKSYPILKTKVEESGEHIILGTGELFMDCVMHDLRRIFAQTEIRVSDPVVTFCETAVEISSLKSFTETANKKNKLTLIAEPLIKGIAEDIEAAEISLNESKSKIVDFFHKKYGWDILAARSVWAFGPDSQGPNVLLDDTLPAEVDKKTLGLVKEYVVQGFQWGTREGPLCEEPIRSTMFKLIDAKISNEPMSRAGGQIIPATRRVIYSSFLLATPRLMEPYVFVECQIPADCVAPIYTVLGRRRGHVIQELPIQGSPLYCVKAYMPAIDTFGFETDLRSHTQGQAFVQTIFDHWQVVPGDPLDKDIIIRPLEPQPAAHLAREFMLKTRRRKGLHEDVSIDKFFDDPMLLKLAKDSVVMSYLL